MGPAGLIALLSGWITTEVGRQPFTVYGLLRTADSVSPIGAPGVAVSLAAFVVVYCVGVRRRHQVHAAADGAAAGGRRAGPSHEPADPHRRHHPGPAGAAPNRPHAAGGCSRLSGDLASLRSAA